VAKKVITTLVDDIDGTEIVGENGETVSFSLDGISYEIDLTTTNAIALRNALVTYVNVARQVKNRATPSRPRVKSDTHGSELATIRQWAQLNGYPAAARGRIPASTIAAFEIATK
jgi:hypothetical protein